MGRTWVDEIQILFDWGAVIAVNKPAGWLSIPGRRNKDNIPVVSHVLGEKLRGHREFKNSSPDLFVVHRLDMGTSGIMLFAKTPDSHKELSRQFLEGEVKKTYWALVKGELKKEICIDAPILKLPSKKNKSVVDVKGKAAQTWIKPLEAFDGMTLVEAKPLTGRTHQIRVHLSYKNFPLIGDSLYGGPLEFSGVRAEYPLLHSRHISFKWPGSLEKEGRASPSGPLLSFILKKPSLSKYSD